MIKLILAVAVVTSATLVGNSFSLKLSNRRKTLESVVKAISRMKTLICFGSFDTTRVVEDCLCDNEFPLLDIEDTDNTADFTTTLINAIENISPTFSLNKSDKKLLSEFGLQLGATDVTGQVAHTELYSQLFTQRLEQAKIQETQKSKLYRILGFSLGCAITLMVI